MKTSLCVLLAALCALLTACSDGSGADQPPQSNPSQSTIVPTRAPGGVAALPDFTPLVEQYGKAVVNVEVIQQPRRTGGPGGLTADDPLLDFFRRFGLPPPQGGESGARHAGTRRRLGLHRQQRRLHPDECTRRRGGRRSHRAAHRPARIRGEGHRLRSAQRRGSDQDRREGFADRAHRRSVRKCGRANGSWRSARRSAWTAARRQAS